MKLSVIMGPAIGEGELQRRRDFFEQSKRLRRARFWTDVHQALISGARGIFIFLLGAALVVFGISHWTEINAAAKQKISLVSHHLKNPANSGALQQGTLNYEKEVEDASR